jgi:GAF domain-containing protein
MGIGIVNRSRHAASVRLRAALLESQRRVLERIASGAPLEEILETLVRLIEEQADGMLCAVLLADTGQQRLHFVTAPSIPKDDIARPVPGEFVDFYVSRFSRSGSRRC